MNKPDRSSDALNKGQVIYRETFDKGPGAWAVGKNAENGNWHRNVFGHRGEGLPLGWSPTGGRTGGYAYSESPWYFDDNHGEFMWFHMPMTGQSELANDIGAGNRNVSHRIPQGEDLRDAVVRITLRGRGLALKGTKLYPWVQGYGGRKPNWYIPGDPLYCWAFTSQPIYEELLDGQWREVSIVLHNDEDKWSQMGLIKGGLERKIRVLQSLTVATGALENILNGHYYCIGFLLGPLDPNDLPSGRIEMDEVSITTRPQ